MGGASDRVGRRPTLAVAIALQVAAFVALASAQSLGAPYVAASLFGCSYGGVSVMCPRSSRTSSGASTRGASSASSSPRPARSPHSGPSAPASSTIGSGSYAVAWWLAAGCNALALGLLVFTHPLAAAPVDLPRLAGAP